MKIKLLFLAPAFILFSGVTLGQTFQFGIKGGATLGKITGVAFKDAFTLGYDVGAFAKIGLGKKLAVQPEVYFSQVNVDTSVNFSNVYSFNYVNNIQLGYLNIPIFLNYNIDKMIAIQVGPQYGVLIDQNKSLLQNGANAFKSGNFSVVGGVQVSILRFKIYGRAVGGQTDIATIGKADTWKLKAYQLGIGIDL
jgi:Outer membrane protein beta-barrel domain